MIALLDLGNSRFKLAPLTEGQPGAVTVMKYGHDAGDSVVKALREMQPDQVYVASVRGSQFDREIRRSMEGGSGIETRFVVTPESGLGVRIAYRDPAHLGVDRYLSMVAVRESLGTAAVVLDCGTAVTIDAVDAHGRHLGGLILPGLQMMRRSLNAGAAEINVNERDAAHDLFATDTKEGVIAGTTRATLASLEKISHDMRASMQSPVSIVIDGGDADYLAPFLPDSFIRMPYLVLRGLAVLVTEE
ncbi:MAG: type III pantothenate kinase [Pseudomonadota bacterium]|nr:type III pantothenate kinase [Pseudomonadota bacterium]